MKLTNYQRDAFVKSVMDDVPHIDYSEKARVLLQKWAIDHLPSKLRALHKEFGHFFATTNLWQLPGNFGHVVVVSSDKSDTMKAMKEDTAFWKQIEELASSSVTQRSEHDQLRSKVRSVIYSCTTVKQAQERLPEFAKYLPKLGAPVDRSVPAVANLVSDLVKAGWPKDAKKATLPKRRSA